MEIISAKGEPYYQNAYLLIKGQTCIIIDPGSAYLQLKQRIEQDNLKLLAILLTHFHFDHVFGVNELAKNFQVFAYIHAADYDWLITDTLARLGRKAPVEVDKSVVKTFASDTKLEFGPFSFSTKHLPGHTPGSVFYLIDDQIFTGDMLFPQTIGRADLPGSDAKAMEISLNWMKDHSNMAKDAIIYPGHGNKTSVDDIWKNNPFFK